VPAPGFSLTIDDATLPLQQQGAPMGQRVGVTGLNGFAGVVSISFPNLPVGFTTDPSGTFQVTSGQTQYFTIAASKVVAIGPNTITAVGTSGSISHTINFTTNVSAAAAFSLTASPSSLTVTPASQTNIVLTLINHSASPSNIVFGLLQSNSALSNLGVNIPAQFNSVGPNQEQYNVQVTLAAQATTNYPLIFNATDTNTFQTSTVTVPLTITHALASNTTPTRSDFERTDENVTGAVYDPQRKLIFATVSQLSEVLVLQSTDKSLRATIPVTQAYGIDEAADGSKVYVGGGGSSIGVIDPDSLQLVENIPPPSVGDPNNPYAYYNPLYVAALSNGKVLILAGVTASTETHVFLWDPAARTMTLRDSGSFPNPQNLTRSADHSKVLLLGPFTSGPNAVMYEAATDTLTGPFSLNGVPALSPDGSQIAASNGDGVSIFDAGGHILGTVFLQNGSQTQTIYSRDGRRVYVFCDFFGAPSVVTIDAHTFVPVGISPDVAINEGAGGIPYDIDETGMVFVGASRGISYVDVSSPGALHLPTFSVFGGFGLKPDAVSTSAPTTGIVNGVSFDPNTAYKVFFGAPPASPNALISPKVTFESTSQTTGLQVTVPPAPPQVANMTITRPDGWWRIAPLAASFGPHIWIVTGNAGPASGGANVSIFGFGLDTATTTVTIGGSSAIVSDALGPSGTNQFSFPVDRVGVATPPGIPGWADITVTTPFGTTTLSKGYQYLASTHILPVNGALNQIIYDRKRRRVYVSNGVYNQVHVFSADSEQFIASIPVGMGPVGLALTPDGTRLAVVNSGSGTVSVVDPDQLKVIRTFNVLTADDSNPVCGGVPFPITAGGTHGMFVGVTCTQLLLQGDLHFLDLNSGSLNCIGLPGCNSSGTSISGVGNSESLASSLDGNLVVVGFYGGAAVLNLSANTLTSGGYNGTSVTIDDDSNLLGLNVGIHDLQFFLKAALEDLDFLDAGFLSSNNIAGAKFSPSGSLFFVPQTPIGGVPLLRSVDVFDTHRQRLVLQIALPEALVAGFNSMCLDETGSKLFLISKSGITIAQLASVPLSIASVSPSSGFAGSTVTIRGSGFQDGAKVNFGSTEGNVTFVDMNTLKATVPTDLSGPTQISVINSDGRQYSYDAAYTAR
jgi:YVTN family beta-propeller protein